MHTLLQVILFAAGFAAFGAAILLAFYGLLGYRPGRAYAAGSIACAIASPVFMALQVWSASSTLDFPTCLYASSVMIGFIYAILIVAGGVGFGIDWYRFRSLA